jgi:hypothetical protein
MDIESCAEMVFEKKTEAKIKIEEVIKVFIEIFFKAIKVGNNATRL